MAKHTSKLRGFGIVPDPPEGSTLTIETSEEHDRWTDAVAKDMAEETIRFWKNFTLPDRKEVIYMQKANVGDVVIWCDPSGRDHNALVQCVWSETCINVLFISPDENRQDSYGRQIEHATSCQHVSLVKVHGCYWRWPSDEKRSYVPPEAK